VANFLLPPNNASTTLAAAASSGATTLTIASAANFPSSIPAGTVMPLTLNDAATRLVFEIVYVTAISGTTLTVERGQEGTAAQSWSIGDYSYSAITNGTETAMANGNGQMYGTDTGAVNTVTVALQPAPVSVAQMIGVPVRVKIANTTTTTTPTLTLTPLAAQTIVNPDGSALGIGQLVAGAIATFILDGTHAQLSSVVSPYNVENLPVATLTASVALTASQLGTLYESGTDSAIYTLPDLSTVANGARVGFVCANSLANGFTVERYSGQQILGVGGLAAVILKSPGDSVLLVAAPSIGPGVWYVLSLSALATTAQAGAIQVSQSLATNGHYILPGGLILQWGTFLSNATGYTNITFPIAFPTGLLSIASGVQGTGTGSETVIFTTASATTTTVPCAVSNGSAYQAININWMAIGY